MSTFRISSTAQYTIKLTQNFQTFMDSLGLLTVKYFFMLQFSVSNRSSREYLFEEQIFKPKAGFYCSSLGERRCVLDLSDDEQWFVATIGVEVPDFVLHL